jgi:diguanylate cyclase (GGDEF)-like protein
MMKDRYIKDVLFSLATFFLILISVNIMLFPDRPGFLGLNPHPYLLAVLLISGRFGLKEGLASALLASLILAVYVYLENHPYFHFSQLTQAVFLIPVISFFVTAIILGEMRGFNKSYERSLLNENSSLKSENRKLKEQLEIVTAIKEELQDRIVNQEETVHSLYKATRMLETLDETGLYQGLARLVSRFTGANKASVYMIDYSRDVIRRVAQFGWGDEVRQKDEYSLKEGILSEVVEKNRMLTIKEISDDPKKLAVWEKSPNRAYVYVPIAMGTVVVGILTVDEIPFLKLNISTVRILSLIPEMAVPALRNIVKYQDLQDMVSVDPVTELLKYESFLDMADIEFKKAARYHLDFSLLLIEVQDLTDIEKRFGHDAKIDTLKWVGDGLKSMLRNIDVLGVGEREGTFWLALPVTSTEGVLAVINRIKNWKNKAARQLPWGSQLTFYFGAVGYHPSIETLEIMLSMAQNSLQLSKIAKRPQQKKTVKA